MADIAPRFAAEPAPETKKLDGEKAAKRSRVLLKEAATTGARPATAKPKPAANQRAGPVKAAPVARPASAVPNKA